MKVFLSVLPFCCGRKEDSLLVTVGGMDADIDDCMDAGGRATHDAKAERTRMYL